MTAQREAGSLPSPDKPIGAANDEMPFDHVVVVMMENHSFDNLLGAMSLSNPEVEGLEFDSAGKPTNSNPGGPHTEAEVGAFALGNTAQAKRVSQSWKSTHEQINDGAMDGFVKSADNREPMGYYPPEVLPFAYSFASTFTVGTRWFGSMPGPTYPNRRFLLAGTAFGGTETKIETLLDRPPHHGTIFDRLSEHHISWTNYFSDFPMTMVIPSIVLRHLNHYHRMKRFFHDCKAGSLPAVSFVDPGIGILSSLGETISKMPSIVRDALDVIGADFKGSPPGETEEDPQSMYWGEAWAHEVVEAVLRSPAWPRTLLVYIYDEHGGYYDHVPPPAAVPPDDIAPELGPDDPPGAYDIYGPRVPAIIASPYSKPGGVCTDVCDHTSVLATIERKWNLPAMTKRDANANTMMGFLDPGNAALLDPPPLAAPSETGPSGP